MALTIIAIGLLTFFLPIIKYDPPVYGQQYWSVLDITQRLHAANPDAPVFLFVPFGLAYLMLLVAMLAVLVLPFRKVLLWISVISFFVLLWPFAGLFGAIRLAAFFDPTAFGLRAGHGGDLKPLWVVLGVTMLAMAGVAWSDTKS